jgi:glycine/D-amino acid oxidase-like deaminating enzyme
MSDPVDVLIIGAGASGAAVAWSLTDAVRRQGFRDNGLDKLREVLAHRVGDVMRPAAGAVSGG